MRIDKFFLTLGFGFLTLSLIFTIWYDPVNHGSCLNDEVPNTCYTPIMYFMISMYNFILFIIFYYIMKQRGDINV